MLVKSNFNGEDVGGFYVYSKSGKLFVTNSINISFLVSRIDGTVFVCV